MSDIIKPDDSIVEYTCHVCGSVSIIGIVYGIPTKVGSYAYGQGGLQLGRETKYHHCPACDEQDENGNCTIKTIRRY